MYFSQTEGEKSLGMEREVERLGAELASTRQVSFLIIMVIIYIVIIIFTIIIIMLQTILRMHEREEKMKERLMDLRLKSEEQVCVFLSCNCFMILNEIKMFVSFFSPQISITSSSTSAVYLSVKGRSGPPGSPRGGSQGSRWTMI